MRNFISFILFFIAGIYALTILIFGLLAYFTVKVGENHQLFDGLGRPQSDSPWFMRLIFGSDKQWVGWKWFLIDMGAFWGSVLVIYLIVFAASNIYLKKELKSKSN